MTQAFATQGEWPDLTKQDPFGLARKGGNRYQRGALTPKQQRFIEEYLLDVNATKAAIRAGYSTKTAEVIGAQLLKKTYVSAAIARAIEERSARTNITQDRVLYELMLVAGSDLDHYAIDDEGNVTLTDLAPRGAKRAIASITRRVTKKVGKDGEEEVTRQTEVKFWSKTDALDMVCKHVGMYAPKKIAVSRTNADGTPHVERTPEERLARLIELARQVEALPPPDDDDD